MNKNTLIIAITICMMVVISCRKTNTNPTVVHKGSINLELSYNVNGQPLIFDSMMYTNAAGNKYSVEKIHYYLSDLVFYANGIVKHRSDSVIYIDARKSSYSNIKITDIPVSNFDSISFNIGLNSTKNISNSLSPTSENVNMGWPDMMGGGYHFLKLEGHWKDNATTVGYAMHIGNSKFVIKGGVKHSMAIESNKTVSLKMDMNINEWFANPHTYDLDKDGVYSMGNMPLMKKLSENGSNVFSIINP